MDVLTVEQVDDFINNGFIKIENAFSAEIAKECREILWKQTGCSQDNLATWTTPVVRIGELGNEPFVKAANTPILHAAFDQLVGIDNWHPKQTLGSFPIRFPSKEPANDTGWHVDASFAGQDPTDFFGWRININSKGRGLLMLFLFSDVTESDAPTILKVGSHLDVGKILEPDGESGLSFMELAGKLDAISDRSETVATGTAGTVYLCHPFMVHSAQNHRGQQPKFMAQPALMTKNDFSLNGDDVTIPPVAKAILKGVGL
jgi:hypothetical protein